MGSLEGNYGDLLKTSELVLPLLGNCICASEATDMLHNKSSGGVVRNGIPYETPVIPAKAGIHTASLWKGGVNRLDSRFRGNDCDLQRLRPANDTITTS
jgi:hypothetical protein